LPAEQFVMCIQNHDQVGNRLVGDRFGTMLSVEQQKLAAGLLLCSPFVPMLFMGEEYGETAPFPFFTSHGDADLIESVRRGRRAEFKAFSWQGDIPDPQGEATFESAMLNHTLKEQEPHRSIYQLYKTLLRLRRELPPLSELCKEQLEAEGYPDQQVLAVRRWHGAEQVLAVFHLGENFRTFETPAPAGKWHKLLASGESTWQGNSNDLPASYDSDGSLSLPMAPHSFVLLHNAASQVQDFVTYRR
jgi:maltooligosyltrehalose trehalohydrolase